MSNAHPRPVVVGALIAVLAVVLSGCDADDGPSAAEVVEGADGVVVAEEDEDSAATVDELDGTVVVEGSDEAAAALAEAVAATRGRDGRIGFSTTADSSLGVDGVIGEGVSNDGDLMATMMVRGELAALYGASDAEVEVRIVDDVVYLDWPAFLAQADVDASWLQIPAGDEEPNLGDLVQRARLASPAAALELLDGVTAVAELEDEFVDGLRTTHYVATVQLGEALRVAGVGADLFTDADRDRALEVHAFVDDGGFVRRIEVEVADDGTTFTLTVDVLEIDGTTPIEAPPEDDVISFDEFVAART